jgi:hypothetical protein
MNIFGSFNDKEYVPEKNSFISLRVVDQSDRHAPHFLELTINQMKIWFSFDVPIGFKTRTYKSAVLFIDDLNSNQMIHAYKVQNLLNTGKRTGTGILSPSDKLATFKSKDNFIKELMNELKKEIIHTSSEVMQTTLLGKE